MGEGGVEARSGGSENNWLGSCETHHVGIRPEEDRGGTAGEVGEGEGSEVVGGVVSWVPGATLFLQVQ